MEDTKEIEFIYHYTTLEALLNMVQENGDIKLWATRYDYLNDSQEFKLGISILNKLIHEIVVEEDLHSSIGENMEIFNESLKELYKSGNAGFYVISFSEESDSLPMWRMYGCECNGIAIGFDYKHLKDEEFHEYFFLDGDRFREIVYEGNERIKELVRKIITKWVRQGEIDETKFMNEYLNFVCETCIFIKSAAFNYEKEHRIAIPDSDFKRYGSKHKPKYPIQFRYRNGVLLPYKEITIPKEMVKRITLGPTADFERCKYSLDMFLQSRNLDIEINQSDVPYLK